MPHARKGPRTLPHPEFSPVGVSALTCSEELPLAQWFVGSAKLESKSELSKSAILGAHGRGLLAMSLPARLGHFIGRLADCPSLEVPADKRSWCVDSKLKMLPAQQRSSLASIFGPFLSRSHYRSFGTEWCQRLG